MAKVYSLSTPFGDCEIHISTKTGLFEVRPLDNDAKQKIESIHKFPHIKTYAEALQQIEDMKSIYFSNFLLNRKVIIIQLQTSESNYTQDDIWLGKKIGEKLTDDKITNGNGFIIQWYVAEEYKLDSGRTEFDRTLYKIIEVGGNSERNEHLIKSKPNTLHQLLYSLGEKRVITYREDLHIWLKSLNEQIREMLNRLLSFFDRDNEKFLQNFDESKLLLNPKKD